MKKILAIFLLLSVLASLVSCKLPRIQFVYDDEPKKDDAVNDDVVNDDVVNDEQDNNSNTPNEDIPVSKITLDTTNIKGHIGDKYMLAASTVPDDATDPTVTWSSNSPKVASVSNLGLVELKGLGEAIITATTSNGKTASCYVTVEKNLEYFEIQLTRENWSDFLEVTVYESQNTIVIVIDPLYDDITYKNVSFDFEFTIWERDSYNLKIKEKNLNCGIGINNVYLYGYTEHWNYSKRFVSGAVSGYIEK